MRVGPRGGGIVGVLIVLAVVLLTDFLERRDADPGSGRGEAPGVAVGQSVDARVLRVVDGDTIEVDLEGRTEDVRYIGIDTPETVKPGAPIECYGEQASSFNKQLVDDERVQLVFDRELRDRFGRLLAYVYVGSTFVNAELIRGGYARTLEIAPNTSMASSLAKLQSDAGAAGRGLWSRC